MRLAIFVSLAAGCAAQLPLPMTAGQLVQYATPEALVAYLHQPDATPVVCDLRARGPHVADFTPEMRSGLVHGLSSGKIEPVLWQRCVDAAIASLPRDQAASLVDDVMLAYRGLVRDDGLATSPGLATRVATIQRFYLERPAGLDGHAKVLARVFDGLRADLAKRKLSPIAASFAGELLATVDAEHGTWQGRPVDTALLDTLAQAGNEMTLARFARRLPDPAMRTEARRRIARVHIALSPFDEVRAAAAAVEDLVTREGRNPVALADHPMTRAWFDETRATIRNVLVRQHVWQQTATLLGFAQQRPTLSVLPELSFRDNLFADLQGVSRPVTLCGPRDALDPSPCIDVRNVTLDNSFAYLDAGSAFHFRDDVREAEVVPWAAREEFALPIRLAGRPAVTLHWGLYFERPENLAFAGSAGGRGPDLDVRVTLTAEGRYVFAVGAYTAVVEGADLASYRVASLGGGGFDGSDGSDGSDGTSGGECQDGGPGGNGGDGSSGGDGGDGGDVHVTLVCAGGACDVATLQRIIFSAGGAGGRGGRGGRGGNGGSGGPSRSPTTHTDSDGNTVTDDPGCSAGSSGASGSSGSDGMSGSDGRAGTVTFTIAR